MVALLALSAAPASTASAQVPTQDSVSGSGVARTVGSDTTFNFQIDARSAPSGQNPTGTVTFTNTTDGSTFFNGPVTCLAVNANFGILNVDTPQYRAVGMEVTDQPSGDLIRAIPTTTSACAPIGTAVSFDVISGDVVVTDAQVPATYAQCRQAGWVKYGYSSHAQCITSVHDWARSKCTFERVAHGISAFRAKYGFAPDQNHAMRHCVRLYTGF
jgi:hypothetical protein